VLISEGSGYSFDSDGVRIKTWWEPGVLPASVAWREVRGQKSSRRHFEAQAGTPSAAFPLESTLKLFEANLDKGEGAKIAFVAEIGVVGAEAPESMLAELWNECLGANAIPFDPDARRALIEEGSKHPELNRHIEAWKEMKRTGSKWVTGG
jgi:hypothetical protein